ncbi:metalloprotease TldD [Sphingopyxis sp.]|uniref:metalloprotease TldD n=1 Tax=Sphingopyxis sp. TaxID=1908224 RepID=UPI002639F57A|nr:metalloprotease TldD [Sphingopyxis sp.]MCW0199446.1 metalloprotease TldD [Sphingopyxis sp.]
MTPSNSQVETGLLTANNLDRSHLDTILGGVMTRSIDYADLYFQARRREVWRLNEGQINTGSHSFRQGVGLRAIAGEHAALSYSDDISLAALASAADTTRAVGHAGRSARIALGNTGRSEASDGQIALYPMADPLGQSTADERVNLLKRVDALARAADPRVSQVTVMLQIEQNHVFIARSDGARNADARPLVRLDITVFAEQNGRKARAHVGDGGRMAFEELTRERVQAQVRKAVDRALRQLDARAAPSGPMTVVLGPRETGILLHEAVGHGLEGDFLRKGSSAFAGLVGQRVAAKGVTVVDDGMIAGSHGSLTIDDEGQPTERTPLIEDGILTGFLHDLHNAHLLGTRSTGNGRRESYAAMPIPRMTNTFMLGGSHDPAEIIGSVASGLYVAGVGGGQVDITNGRFVFQATDAYLIENGRLTAPVKGATLVGSGPETLKHIAMIGNDLAIDGGSGMCGKAGQNVPVGVGQPTVRIDGMTVGGTA